LKTKKIKRSNTELLQSLIEQLKLLQINCNLYDAGNEIVGKSISTILRILFHESRSSKSLLVQLGIRDISWLNTSHGLHLDNQISECSLLTLQMKAGSGGKYLPKCLCPEKTSEYNYKIFPSWYNMPVILDEKHQVFTRREIILYVADTDGGAHIDGELDEKYREIIKPNYLGWKYGEGMEFQGKVELICMRQIAYEVLTTLMNKYPGILN